MLQSLSGLGTEEPNAAVVAIIVRSSITPCDHHWLVYRGALRQITSNYPRHALRKGKLRDNTHAAFASINNLIPDWGIKIVTPPKHGFALILCTSTITAVLVG